MIKDTLLRELLEEDFCNSLGTSYQPYVWIEEVCDEMIERIGMLLVFLTILNELRMCVMLAEDVIGVVKFHAQVRRTGMQPSESLVDMMCREHYKCSKVNQEEL